MSRQKNTRVRFAPSPTGFLHIGGARTALFNWLFARHNGGEFLLRIEDTDRARSTAEAIEAIIEGLRWLGLDWDGEIVRQSERAERHHAVAMRLLTEGKAYRCYCSAEELAQMRQRARAEGRPTRYDGRWRDRDVSEAPAGARSVIRFRAPRDGETVIADRVQGEVRTSNDQLDDMVLLRGNGTPTYMLSVVVDDHDMAITHVIRGDDHLNNAARQYQLYLALGWGAPEFAHIPLIHGPDGAKLSKRHGALGVAAYEEMGYLPEAMRNYLLRLGWARGDEEIISTEQAIEWFSLEAVGRSPARFDFAKLEHLNGHYIRQAEAGRLSALIEPRLAELSGRVVDDMERRRLALAMPSLRERAKTLVELTENARFCTARRPLDLDEKAQKMLESPGREILALTGDALEATLQWTAGALEQSLRSLSESEGVKFGKIAQPLRAALTGRAVSPGIFDVLMALGRSESLARIGDQTG